MIFALITSVFILSASAESTNIIPANDAFFVQQTKNNQVRIMSYNVNNLFDTEHDEDSFDWAFLPKNYPGKMEQCKTVKQDYYEKQCAEIDWTPAKLKIKINQIKKVLTSHGTVPDILALQEIENEKVIAMLAKAVGYSKYVVTDYGAHRGVDVAVLYNDKKLTLISEDYVETPGRDPYRLKFEVKSTKETFFVYVNHWLAQSAPEEYRKETAQALADDVEDLMAHDPNVKVVALGDFNVTDGEEEEIYFETFLNPKWKNRLVDVHAEARSQFPNLEKKFPNGSYYYPGKNLWRRFDRFFVTQGFLKGKTAKIDLSSYRVIYSKFLTGIYDYKVDYKDPNSEVIPVSYPLKYNFTDDPKYPQGYSDHLPISVIMNF